ncbi:MAG: ABC transporter permease [Nitrospirae bacterium]|jgi:phospholipid/cholesterol/gamma-HCH transport system permease protein|nr:ABC transporter permease [Nitrospirota bacterium]
MEYLRKKMLDLLQSMGDFSLMVAKSFRYMATHFRTGDTLIQMDRIGVGSIPIVFLASIFAGLDMALQFEVVMAPYGARALLGKVVTTSIIRDMGPVLASLVMSARVTAGISSELGMMNSTQQIDALRVMGIDPVDRLVAPRIFSGIVMMPILSVSGDFLALLAGLGISMTVGHVPAPLFWSGVRDALTAENLTDAFLKPLFFGFILTSIGCHYGMKSASGAFGVGKSTTKAVVAAAIWILVANFLLSKLLINVWGLTG